MESTNIPEICRTVCFTGHRVLSHDEQQLVYDRLDKLLRLLIESHGTRDFYAGGALGLDTCAAITVLALRKQYEGIRLHIAIPCRDQDARWTDFEKAVYRNIINRADTATVLSERYFRGCMQMRNRHMIERSDLCIAFLRPGTDSGGTVYTANYARRQGVPLINVAHPDWRIPE